MHGTFKKVEFGSKEHIESVRPADMALRAISAEVNRGKWLRTYPTTKKSYKRICSACQGVAYMIGREYPYCPNCGAAMAGETDD